ncbi:MAG: hypothetical protein A2075_09175 [Geobacteraceae bacterium GWC2_58_44]|nr:MAG: hypothetical protein A2075_09175 [Geobacteraceae bacterium GWC2_58_44]HBG07684.1 hypothetical protein [Geobacter sp.]
MQHLPKKEELLTVKEIWQELDQKISLRQIYNLIERGDLAPAFRFAGIRGTCVPKQAVIIYKNRCLVDIEV